MPATRSTPARRRPASSRSDVQDAVDAIRRIVRALRLAEQATRAAGLSAAQTFVLTHLATTPAASLGELAAFTLTDRSSVAAVVERLVEAKLAVADRDASDRRRVTVRITPAGRRALEAAPPAPTDLLIEALGRLPGTARRALARDLGALASVMGLDDLPATMLFEDGAEPGRAR